MCRFPYATELWWHQERQLQTIATNMAVMKGISATAMLPLWQRAIKQVKTRKNLESRMGKKQHTNK